MEYKIKRIGRRRVYQGSLLTFYEDTMMLPDGKIARWDYVQHPRNGACIVPVLPDGRILMIRQYRPVLDRETLELPAGARDYVDSPGMADSRDDAAGMVGTPDGGLSSDEKNPCLEDPSDTAFRELREETGYECGKLTHLLRLKAAVAWCNETTDVYLAEALTPVGGQELDEAEEIRTEAYELPELLAMIRESRIEDAKTVAGLLAYADYCRTR